MRGPARHTLYCPDCGKKAGLAVSSFIRHSIYRLDLPVFLCGDCRTVFIEALTVKRIVKEWRESSAMTRHMPLDGLVAEYLEELETLVRTHYVARLGYRRTRFLLSPNKTSP